MYAIKFDIGNIANEYLLSMGNSKLFNEVGRFIIPVIGISGDKASTGSGYQQMMLPAEPQKTVPAHFNIALPQLFYNVKVQFFCAVPWHFFTDGLNHFFNGNGLRFFYFLCL
jgi:hypothetical protein